MRRCRGEEPLSEFLACQLAEQICPQAVHYDLGFYHQKLISKCRPRIGVDFNKTAKGMLTDEIRQELKNLDGFRFAPHPTIELPKGRLEALSDVVERQRRAILE